MQVTVDGNDLDNGTTRRIFDEWQDSLSADGERVTMVGFQINAANAADLATLYASTISDFVKRNVTCVVDHGGSDIISIGQNDGTHLGVSVGMVGNDRHKDGPLSLWRTLVIQAELAGGIGGGGGGAGGQEGGESFQVTTIRAPGRNRTIVASGTFFATSGNTALANYTAARSAILTTNLLTESTGARDGTSKMTLVNETFSNVDGDNSRLEFTLESEEREFAYANTASARNDNVQITTTEPEIWNSAGGAVPSIITAAGSIFLDKAVLAGAKLKATWDATLKADVTAEVSTATGVGDLTEVAVDATFDENQGLVQFSIVWQGNNASTLSYRRSDQVTEEADEAFSVDAAGFTHVQTNPASPTIVHRVTVTRIGRGFQTITSAEVRPRPVKTARQVRFRRQVQSSENQIRKFGQDVVEQTITFEYTEIKTRANINDGSQLTGVLG